MRTTLLLTVMGGLLLSFVGHESAADDPTRGPEVEAEAVPVEARFRESVRPFLETYCLGCHGKDKPEGDLDLSAFATAESVAKDLGHWELVLEQLEAESMPPKKAQRHPSAEARE